MEKFKFLGIFFALVAFPMLLLSPQANAAEVQWLSSVDEAISQAAKTDQYILVDLYADWCGWCKVLEKDVFTTPEFIAFAKDYIPLRVDVEDRGEGSELQAKYNASSLPTTLILDASGVQIGAVAGFAPTAQFIGHLKAAIQRYDKSLEIFAKLKGGDDPRLLHQLAKELHERRDGLRAAQIYDRIREVTQKKDPAQSAWLYFRQADAYRMGAEFGRAEASLSKARSIMGQVEQKAMHEQLDMLSFYVAHDRGDCHEAMTRLEHFLSQHPRSQMRFQANKTLQKLRRSDGENC